MESLPFAAAVPKVTLGVKGKFGIARKRTQVDGGGFMVHPEVAVHQF